MDDHKIFLTDLEFDELFGPEISRLARILNTTAREICLPCNGKCCKEIRCVFYSDKFSLCPIFEIRPRECRYHFCNNIFSRAPMSKEEKELLIKPVEELICGGKGEVARLFFLFPEFPLDENGLVKMGIMDAVTDIINAFEKGCIDEESASQQLKELCNV